MNNTQANKATPESVWAAIQAYIEENRIAKAEADKRQAEWNKQFAESKAEYEKRQAKADKEMSELRKQIGGISKSNGMMAEENIYNALDDELTFAGIQFYEMERRFQLRAEPFGKIETDIDVLLRNGEALAIIEVKYRVEKSDVKNLLYDKLEKVKRLYPKHKNYKILLGIGGMSFEDGAEDEAKKNGIGIIKVVGEKVEYFTENITTY